MQNMEREQQCANCHRVRTEWRSNNSEGFTVNGKTYCCEGCVTGQCSCTLMQSAPRLEKNVLDTPDAKAKGLE